MQGIYTVAKGLLAAILVAGLLPLAPLVNFLMTTEASSQHCSLHGADCQCQQHCNRTQNHSHPAALASAPDEPENPSCHREQPQRLDEQVANSSSTPTTKCVWTSCGDEQPLLLASQVQPYLGSALVSEPHGDRRFEAAPVAEPLSGSSLKPSPPTPPPKA